VPSLYFKGFLIMFLEKINNEWVFQKGKYRGETLDKVAQKNLKYLKWLRKNMESLSNEEFYAITDIIETTPLSKEKEV